MDFIEEEELELPELIAYYVLVALRTVLVSLVGVLFLYEAAEFVRALYEGIFTMLQRIGRNTTLILKDLPDPDRPDGNNASSERSESHASILPPKSEILEHDEKQESTLRINLFPKTNEAQVCENLGEGCNSLLREEEIDGDIDSDFVMVPNESKMAVPWSECLTKNIYATDSDDSSASDDSTYDDHEEFPDMEFFGCGKFGSYIGSPVFDNKYDPFFRGHKKRISNIDRIEFPEL